MIYYTKKNNLRFGDIVIYLNMEIESLKPESIKDFINNISQNEVDYSSNHFISELLKWNFYNETMLAVLQLVIIIIVSFYSYKFIKFFIDYKDFVTTVCLIVVYILWVFIWSACLYDHVQDAVKIEVAPRLWLIEYVQK